MFLMFFVIALVVGHLTTRLRERERIEHRREQRATALYQLTRELAASDSRDAAVRVVMAQIQKGFRAESGGAACATKPAHSPRSPHPASTWTLPRRRKASRRGPFKKATRRRARRRRFPNPSALHLPLLVADRIEGVLAVELAADAVLAPEQRELLEAFATQLAVVAEKERSPPRSSARRSSPNRRSCRRRCSTASRTS